MFVMIIGGGNTGSYLAKALIESGHSVRVVEERKAILDKLAGEISPDSIVAGDGSSPITLEAAGVRKANVLAAVTGSDETNLVITSLGKFEFAVPRVIARVNNPKNAWLFTREMGVDVALNQAEILGRLIAEEMSLGDMMTLLKLRRGEFSLIEEKVYPTAPAANKALRDLGLPAECTIVALIRNHEMLIPRGDMVLKPADEVLALVHSSKLKELAALLGPITPVVRND